MPASRMAIAFTLLYLAIASTVYIYAYISTPEPGIIVLPMNTCMDIALQDDGRVLDRRVVCSDAVLPLERGVRKIVVNHEVLDVETSFEILIRSRHRVYIAPPSTLPSKRKMLRMVSYSIYDAWWPRAPENLWLALGGRGAYVEESMAGRLIEYLRPSIGSEPVVRGILSHIEPEQRSDIAVAALWAAQIAREAREQEPDIATNFRGLEKIVGEPASVLMAPLWSLGIQLLRYVPREEVYRSLLFALRSSLIFNQSSPAWRAIDESTWVELCRAVENYTVSPAIPSYAHSLVLGALIAAHGMEIVLVAIFVTLIALSLWLLSRTLIGLAKPVQRYRDLFSILQLSTRSIHAPCDLVVLAA